MDRGPASGSDAAYGLTAGQFRRCLRERTPAPAHGSTFGTVFMATRREKLEAMLADDPADQFLRYALAMELDKDGEHAPSLELLTALTKDDPPHVAAFFMAGQQLARLDRVNEARDYLRDGIETARAAGDAHAAGEMSEFLATLGAAGE